MTVADAEKSLDASADRVWLLERHARLEALGTTAGVRPFRRGDIERWAAARQ